MDHQNSSRDHATSLLQAVGLRHRGCRLVGAADDRLFAQQPDTPFAPRAPHFAPKAKQIIYLFMAGAPTQLDLFDNKPALQKFDGQEIPAEFVPER